MTVAIERKNGIFKIKEIWFADMPEDIRGYDLLIFRAVRDKFDKEGFFRRDLATFSIDLNQSLDDIWKKMEDKSCRYSIKRAQREGVVVRLARHEDYEEFYRLTRSFNEKKGLALPRSGDLAVWRENGILFIAEQRGSLLAGNLYFADRNIIRWAVGASRRLDEDVVPSSIGWANASLIWEAIKYAKQKGIKEFDLGGCYAGSDKNDARAAIKFFKEKFGGDLVDDYTYYRYSGLYRLLHEFAERLRSLNG
jgi:hypothetical protein